MKQNIQVLKHKLIASLRLLGKYAAVVFVLFFVVIYSFLLWRIITLNQIQPSQSDLDAQLQTAKVPHIDQSVVDKIKQLQDNSVNVQTLFDKARSSPFQE